MAMTTDKAEVTLPSDREVTVTRPFKAAPALIYGGHPGWSMPVCDMDVRVGGKYEWRWRSADAASEFGFHGTFREIQPPSRIVHTEVFDPGSVGGPHPESEAVVTTMFAEEGGITTLTTIIDFGSKEARDAALKTGMTDGMEQSYQLLDRLIETL